MILDPSQECRIITDTNCDEDSVPEQPIIVESYSDGLSITGYDGDSVHMPYRMVKEVMKAMNAFYATKG